MEKLVSVSASPFYEEEEEEEEEEENVEREGERELYSALWRARSLTSDPNTENLKALFSVQGAEVGKRFHLSSTRTRSLHPVSPQTCCFYSRVRPVSGA